MNTEKEEVSIHEITQGDVFYFCDKHGFAQKDGPFLVLEVSVLPPDNLLWHFKYLTAEGKIDGLTVGKRVHLTVELLHRFKNDTSQ